MSGSAELLLLLVGCAPLQDGGYLGEPLLTMEGEILQQISLSELDGEPTATVIWTPGASRGEGGPADEPPTPVQHQQVWVRTEFPSSYQIQLFDEPPEESIHAALGEPSLQVGTGTVVLFMDLDGDGLIDWGDEGLIGAAERVLLTWSEPEGYGLGRVPEDCDGPGFVRLDLESDDVDIVVAEDVCEAIVDPDCDPGSVEWGDDCRAHPGSHR